MSITIERATQTEECFNENFELMLKLHKEGGFAPLNVEKMAGVVFRLIGEGMVFVAKNSAGDVVGTLAMTENSFWYADASFLCDVWFFVLPKYRRGAVGRKLMRAARDEADARGKMAFISVKNPDRRPKKTRMALESQTAGYVPIGHTTQLR